MTHRLADTTRNVAFAAAGTAVVAAADLLDRHDGTAVLVAAIGLLVGALLLARTREVALVVTEDQVELRGVLKTRTLDRDEVVGITATNWNSFVELRDGRSVMTMLRAEDLDGLDLAQPVEQHETATTGELVSA